MNNVDVSVLIPAWNAEMTLARAIRSAANQGKLKVEIIVCDNGSIDDTYAEARRMENQSYPINAFRLETNQGFTGAMNASAEKAQGRYMIPLGGDDWFAPYALAELVKQLDKNIHVDFAYGCLQFHGRRSDIYTPPPFNADEFYVRNASNYAVMFRRRVWDRGVRWGSEIEPCVGVPDWDFVLQMIESGSIGLACADVPVLNWIFAHGSNTDKTWAKQAESLTELKRRHPKVSATEI